VDTARPADVASTPLTVNAGPDRPSATARRHDWIVGPRWHATLRLRLVGDPLVSELASPPYFGANGRRALCHDDIHREAHDSLGAVG